MVSYSKCDGPCQSTPETVALLLYVQLNVISAKDDTPPCFYEDNPFPPRTFTLWAVHMVRFSVLYVLYLLFGMNDGGEFRGFHERVQASGRRIIPFPWRCQKYSMLFISLS